MPTLQLAPYQPPGLWAGLGHVVFRDLIDSHPNGLVGKHGIFPTIGYVGYLNGITRNAQLYDFRSLIGVGATVTRARFYMRCDGLNRPDIVAPVAISLHNFKQAIESTEESRLADYRPGKRARDTSKHFTGTALNAANGGLDGEGTLFGPFDYAYPLFMDQYDGRALRAGQAWPCNSTDNLRTLWFHANRTGDVGTGTFAIEHWTTTGTGPDFRKDTLIGSYPTTGGFATLPTSGQGYLISFLAPAEPVTSGEVYWRELVATPTGGTPDANARINVWMQTGGLYQPSFVESEDGLASLTGYYANYSDEQALFAHGRQPPGEMLLTLSNFGTGGLPWVANTLYSWGDEGTAPDGYDDLDGGTEAPGLAALIQQGLDNPDFEGWLSFRLAASSGLSSTAMRAWHGPASATETTAGLFGPVIEFDYTLPPPPGAGVTYHKLDGGPTVDAYTAGGAAVDAYKLDGGPTVDAYLSGGPAVDSLIAGGPTVDSDTGGGQAVEIDSADGGAEVDAYVSGGPTVDAYISGGSVVDAMIDGGPAVDSELDGGPAVDAIARGQEVKID